MEEKKSLLDVMNATLEDDVVGRKEEIVKKEREVDNLLDRLNEKIASELQDDITEQVRAPRERKFEITDLATRVFLQYELCKDQGIDLTISFSALDYDTGILSYTSEAGIRFFADLKLLYPEGFYDKKKGANWIGRQISGRITQIDREAGTVIFTPEKQNSGKVIRSRIAAELKERLKEKAEAESQGKKAANIAVNGRVFFVNESCAMVKIADSDAIGRVYRERWAPFIVNNLMDYAKKGEVYRFNVVDSKKRNNGGFEPIFTLEHASYCPDAANLLDEDIIKKGAVLSVKCTWCDPVRMIWSGVSVDERLGEHVRIRGVIKKGRDREIPVVGKTYQCMVSHVNPERQTFKVVIFRAEKKKDAYGINGIPNIVFGNTEEK